jgi:hypothetical protein
MRLIVNENPYHERPIKNKPLAIRIEDIQLVRLKLIEPNRSEIRF